MDAIVIGIPTFRRQDMLRQLLEALRPELRSGVTIVVADNECSDATRVIIENWRHPDTSCVYVPVPVRGLAAVRNTLVAAADREAPGWRWLAMLDDDGLVTPGWLAALQQCGDRFDADLVGGPVLGVLPEGAGLLARNSIFAARRRWPTGLVPTLNTTQNLMIAGRLPDRIGRPLFRDDYGASGGEDYDLFRRVAEAGGRIAWCDEAVVREPTALDRLTPQGVMSRYYTTGIYMSHIDRAHDGVRRSWRIALGGMAGAVLETLRGVASADRSAGAKGVLSLSHYTGRIVGMLGGRTARYVQDAKKD